MKIGAAKWMATMALALMSLTVIAADDGPLHYKGEGVEVRQLSDYEAGTKMHAAGNIEMAIKMFEQGAKEGDAKSQFALATYYYFGEGVPQDYAKAHELLQASSKQGDVNADTVLGIAYRLGNGVSVDSLRAVEYLTKAANACVGTAQNELAKILYAGEGVAQDKEQALQWLYLAVEGGNEDAGDGVTQVEAELTEQQRLAVRRRVDQIKKTMVCAE